MFRWRPFPIKKKANLEKLKLANDARAQKVKKRNEEIERENEEKQTTINTILVTMAILRADLAQMNSTVVSLRKNGTTLRKEIEEIEEKILRKEMEIEKLNKQKHFMRTEDSKRIRLIENQKSTIEESQKEIKNLIQDSPTSGRSLFSFDEVVDRKSKVLRCQLVINSIKKIIKSDEVDSFLRFFFQFLNDSSQYAFRYQLSEEETFFCKVRFHLPDTFFRLFKRFYRNVTGFDVFKSRHDIAKIGRNLSQSHNYEVLVQNVPTKCISGRTFEKKCPLVRITSLVEVLSSRLSTLAQHSRLLFNKSTGDCISVVLSGDKGGEETKIVLILENIDKPNNSKSHLLLGYYTGNDDFESLKKYLQPVFDQFNQLKQISYHDGTIVVTRAVKRKLVGDIKIMCTFYNHPGAQCLQSCFLCFISYSNHGVNMATCGAFPFDVSHGIRTLETYKQSGQPVWEKKFGLDYFVSLASQIDLKKYKFPDNIAMQKERLKELETEEEIYVKRIKVLCEDVDKLQDIKDSLLSFDTKKIRPDKRSMCSSKYCISKLVNKKINDVDSYQCGSCLEIFHYCCNAIVSMGEKARAQIISDSSLCFECSCADTLIEREKIVDIKINEVQRVIGEEETLWEEVDEEKGAIKKVVKKCGDAGSKSKQLDEMMNAIGCRNYSCSKNLTGNMTRKFLRKQSIDSIAGLFPASKKTEDVKKLLYSFERLMTLSNAELKSDEQLKEISDEVILVAGGL
ncbi:hypothetical protein CAEBREN_31532 [Caenorhabditis brenneri]|uniref:Zinc finger PHD-type domain-containing protein n=1 Tax=Caenorhabditis brenneri TaxID=135651 RepID=G0NPE0_CAEBE|nr:hypothetical protein CAEBREN_31532 [Caenorhabditis brenneri]